MPGVVLTSEQVKLLQEVLDAVRGLPVNRPILPFDDDRIPQSPDIYIALPQESSGIPALTSIGLDPQAGDVPGSAKCDIYKIFDGELIEVPGLDKTVHNVSGSTISQDWIKVARDKFGKWLALTGGGVGSKVIRFTITTVLTNSAAEATVGARSVGDTTDGSVIVHDPTGCLTLVAGQQGYAVYMTHTPVAGTGTGTGDDGTPIERWEIISLCCA